MNILTRIGDLYFDQKKFFEEEKSKKVGWAVLIVLISGIISAIYASNIAMKTIPATSFEIPSGLIVVSAIISAIIMAFVTWIVISLLFFICLKLFGHSDCKFGDTLRIQGYVTGLLLLQIVIQLLVSLVGTPAPVALLLFSYVFMAWSIPVWYFGFKSVSTKITRKELWTSILIPVIIMAIVSLFTAGIFG